MNQQKQFVKVMIVDDMEDIRAYLTSVLEKEPSIQVVGTAATGFEAISMARSLLPDVILMDIQMESSFAGIEATEAIHDEFPDIKITILTIHEEDNLLFRAYAAGAMDYIIKSNPEEAIIHSTLHVYENQLMIRPSVAEKIRSEFNSMITYKDSVIMNLNILMRLTNSELDILKSVYEGYSYREIAAMRYVSLPTIKCHVNSILKKFQKCRMKEVLKTLHTINFEELVKQF